MERASTDLQEKLDALQDEVELLKNEVKQCLVDLREVVMKDRGLSGGHKIGSNGAAGWPSDIPNVAPTAPTYHEPDPPPADENITATGARRRSGDLESLDTAVVGSFIQWMGAAKGKGISLQRVAPYLEAYEAAGYLTPATTMLMVLSLADLDRTEDAVSAIGGPSSNLDYAQCLLELHDFVCGPGYTRVRLTENSDG